MPHKDGYKPVVSIVIPVHNQAALTAQCFRSIRAKTRTPYEIIWVDNGSSSENFEIIRRQATRPRMHTKLVRFSQNMGFVKATNYFYEKE